ncbi:MAG: GNAT family N-acetyltransferase, partial [Stackebrandtia sp.]
MADLKAMVMRPDLERLGYWNRDWARRRFLTAFVPDNTRVIECEDDAVGLIAVRATGEAQWIEHFYLDPAVHGRGIGGQVLTHVMDTHRDHRPYMLAINRGSAARRLYERHGFVYLHDDDNGVDQIFHARLAAAPHGSRERIFASRPLGGCGLTHRWVSM